MNKSKRKSPPKPPKIKEIKYYQPKKKSKRKLKPISKSKEIVSLSKSLSSINEYNFKISSIADNKIFYLNSKNYNNLYIPQYISLTIFNENDNTLNNTYFGYTSFSDSDEIGDNINYITKFHKFSKKDNKSLLMFGFSHIVIDYSKRYFNNIFIYDELNDILSNTKRFIFLQVSIYFPNKEGHAVSILIDNKNKNIELFDPHMNYTKREKNFLHSRYDLLGNKLKEINFLRDYNFIIVISPDNWNNPQIEADLYVGMCNTYALMYVEYRIKNPDISIDNIVLKMKKGNVNERKDNLSKYANKWIKLLNNKFNNIANINMDKKRNMVLDLLVKTTNKLYLDNYISEIKIDNKIIKDYIQSIHLLENRNDIEMKYGKKSDGYYLLIKDDKYHHRYFLKQNNNNYFILLDDDRKGYMFKIENNNVIIDEQKDLYELKCLLENYNKDKDGLYLSYLEKNKIKLIRLDNVNNCVGNYNNFDINIKLNELNLKMKKINRKLFLSNNYDLKLDKKSIKDFPIITITKNIKNTMEPVYSVGLDMYKIKYYGYVYLLDIFYIINTNAKKEVNDMFLFLLIHLSIIITDVLNCGTNINGLCIAFQKEQIPYKTLQEIMKLYDYNIVDDGYREEKLLYTEKNIEKYYKENDYLEVLIKLNDNNITKAEGMVEKMLN